MCGIVGGVAERNVVPILLEGLRRLEYRGYDSAGIAVVDGGAIQRVRSTGRVAELAERCVQESTKGNTGIGHTRWATHGAPSERNAHPHISRDQISVVHNGIIENHEVLRTRLQAMGYVFTSDTDTEVIAHLVHYYYQTAESLRHAVTQAVSELTGAYAIGVVAVDQPHTLICSREGSPLLIGMGFGEYFIASDVSAVLPVTQRVIYLEEGDVAELTLAGVAIFDVNGTAVERKVVVSELSADVTELGQYRHYMQKEIHEQPKAIADTLEMLTENSLTPELFGPEARTIFADIDSVLILACGTSYHSGCIARYWIEEFAGIPCTVEIASEYRYRTSVPNPKALVITISQSGETADTLAALKQAQAAGHVYSLTICNVPESALMRASRLKFLTRAGPEIGVASTKAFTTQLVSLALLAQVLAKSRGRLEAQAEKQVIQDLRHLPLVIKQALAIEPQLQEWAAEIAERRHALFLGRGACFPVAMEGALKLKEISYIHAEAYAAGELKHGPLALVDKEMPVIVVAPNDHLIDKLKSNIQEVSARGGILYVLAEEGADVDALPNIKVLTIPAIGSGLSAVSLTVPLQVLSYHTALKKGTDVDKPRNLAKSVTVE